jgi:hypothetical protein
MGHIAKDKKTKHFGRPAQRTASLTLRFPFARSVRVLSSKSLVTRCHVMRVPSTRWCPILMCVSVQSVLMPREESGLDGP